MNGRYYLSGIAITGKSMNSIQCSFASCLTYPMVLMVVAFCANDARGQVFDERFEDWPVNLKIQGTIIASGDATVSLEVLESLFRNRVDPSLVMVIGQPEQKEPMSAIEKFFGTSTRWSVDELFTGEPLIGEPLTVDEFAKIDLIVWQDHREASEFSSELLKRVAEVFRAHIARGKTLMVVGPQSKSLSAFFIASIHEDQPIISRGMNLLPEVVLESRFDDSAKGRSHVLSVLACHPQMVGIGLEKDTVLILRGRKLQVFGSGQAVLMLNGSPTYPARLESISPETARERTSERVLADLTEWRRDAIDRTLAPFPPNAPETPWVEKGTLMIVGGGGMPTGLMGRFVEAAGGVDNAKLVYVPCEEADEVAEEQGMVSTWKRMGVKNATFVHTKDRLRANQAEDFLLPLKDATGIWFGGGRQWNLADSYYGTAAHRCMKEVLHRGGVIGGSSAGASIQARYLARATPIDNFKIMAPGYERGGLGFISGVAIDQHFTQRRRQPDMTQLVNRYQQLLGIGIDEATAITVVGSKATVSGTGKVYFYDRRQPVVPDREDFLALGNGQSYDLANRKEISDSPATF